MRTFGQFLGRSIIFLGVLGLAMWTWGPYEPVSLEPTFDKSAVGEDVDSYFASQEARFDDLNPEVHKRVVWHGETGTRTQRSVVYVHGFSATSEEIRPVPDLLAEQLGANLVYTRLAGHGRDGQALAEATVQDWANDLAEALEVARRISDEIVIVATSTGATLAAGMIDQEDVMRDVRGLILVSPNFGVNNAMAGLLTLPAARHWLPVIAGKTRSWEPRNEAQAQYWTTSYPSVAVLQMAALVKRAVEADYAGVSIPTMFLFTDADQVVDATKTREVIAKWGGPHEVVNPAPTEGMDPASHVLAGDILSPNANTGTVDVMLRFINEL